jgi:hypothetical protein
VLPACCCAEGARPTDKHNVQATQKQLQLQSLVGTVVSTVGRTAKPTCCCASVRHIDKVLVQQNTLLKATLVLRGHKGQAITQHAPRSGSQHVGPHNAPDVQCGELTACRAPGRAAWSLLTRLQRLKANMMCHQSTCTPLQVIHLIVNHSKTCHGGALLIQNQQRNIIACHDMVHSELAWH